MIRTLLPTDVVAVIYFNNNKPVNHAKPRVRLGARERGIPELSLLTGWFPKQKRYSIALFRRGVIHGLVSARSCSGAEVWEIDKLMLFEGEHELCLALLEKLSAVLAQFGVEKLFLSLPSDSPLVELVESAGFSCYVTESLYRFREGEAVPSPPPYTLRPKFDDDEYKLFQLYNAVTPLSVRSVEGLIFQEWRQCREQTAKAELIYEWGGYLLAWLRVIRDKGIGQFEIMTELDEAELGYLVEHGMMLLDGSQPIFCLSPNFQHQLQRVLTGHGFEPIAEYFRLVKQLKARAHKLQLMPLRA
jgi:hypothetical protein